MELTKIVVPYDFSDESGQALMTAKKLATNPEDMFVIYVIPDLTVTEPGVVWEKIDDEHRVKHAEEAVTKAMEEAGVGNVQIHVSIGDAGREIVDFADTVKADVIVISSHGRTGFMRVLLGSVAERVVRLAHCSVLVLKKAKA